MSKSLSVTLDVPRLVAQRARLNGCIPLPHFKRLADYLLTPAIGNLEVELAFGPSEQHAIGVVRGSIHGDVELECHRCANAMIHRFDARFALAFVSGDAEAEQVSDHYEPIVLDEGGQIRSVDLIEDELILQLPIAPRHEDSGQCIDESLLASRLQADDESQEGQRDENPFAALKKLNLNKH